MPQALQQTTTTTTLENITGWVELMGGHVTAESQFEDSLNAHIWGLLWNICGSKDESEDDEVSKLPEKEIE